MQDRYAGDIGDYIKIGLLRALSPSKKLGVAWYRYPNEHHNDDGKHIRYLQDPDRWRYYDPELFDLLAEVVSGVRSTDSLEASGALDAVFHGDLIVPSKSRSYCNNAFRDEWFRGVMRSLEGCDLVFADPDNGLVDDAPGRRNKRNFGKRIPISEALALAKSRTVVVYHHNSRFRGGHDLEINHWIDQLSLEAMAVKASAYSCRTFFILNPDDEIKKQTAAFCKRWRPARVSLHRYGAIS